MDLIIPPAAPMIVVVPRLSYPGLHVRSGICAFAHTLAVADRVIYALVVELEDNPSTSITNAAEALHAKVLEQLTPWVDPGGARPYRLVCFEAYEYRIRARRNAGQPHFADPFTSTVTVGEHGAAIWGPPEPGHAVHIEALTRALVAQKAICPEFEAQARSAA